MTGLGMANGTWEDAEQLVGTVIAEHIGADAVNTPMIRHYLEAFEWDGPGLEGAPASMYITFGMPAYWQPGDSTLPENTLAPLAFRLVPCPGSAMIGTEVSVRFHAPIQVGDILRSTWMLTKLVRKRLKIGDGAFLDFEVRYVNQRDELVALESTTVFRYDPEEV